MARLRRESVTNRIISHRSTGVSKIIQSVRDEWWKRNARVISKYIAQVHRPLARSARTQTVARASTNNYTPFLPSFSPPARSTLCTRYTKGRDCARSDPRNYNSQLCGVLCWIWNLTFDVYNFRNKPPLSLSRDICRTRWKFKYTFVLSLVNSARENVTSGTENF